MSSDPGPIADPAGPPWSVDVLADLHAGVFPDDVSARLRAQVVRDPDAAAILAALDSTVDALSLLPSPRMPERYALRLDAAIAVESAASSARVNGPAPRGSTPGARQMTRSRFGPPGFRGPPDENPAQSTFPQLTSTPPTGAFPPGYLPPRSVPAQFDPPDRFSPQGRPGVQGPPGVDVRPGEPGTSDAGGPPNVISLDAARRRRRRWIGGIGIAAAVVIAATVTLTSLHRSPASTSAQSEVTTSAVTGPGGPNALELTPGQFQDAYKQINGAHSGPLTDPIVSAACYGANDIIGTDVLGVTQVTYDGQQASAVAVRINATQARIVVVGLDCGVGGAKAALGSETVTR